MELGITLIKRVNRTRVFSDAAVTVEISLMLKRMQIVDIIQAF